MNKIFNTDFAYIAGYIDGDGCFHIGKVRRCNRTYKFYQMIVISSVNCEVLDWCKELWGGSIRTNRHRTPQQKPLHQYTLRKFRAIPLATNIIPYLVEKREEVEKFLRFAASDEILERIDLINEIKILKDISNLVSKYHKDEFERFRNTVQPTEIDFAYLAGFIDAECSLNIQKYKPHDRPNYVYKILLQCNNTKAPVFKWLLERFGGTIHFVDRLTHQKARKNQLTWRLSGNALSQILDKIYPFLKHKKPVCKALMNFYATTLINGGARHTEIFRSQYAKTIEERERIVALVHKLNEKGIKSS